MNATIPTIPSLPSLSAQATEAMQVSETRYRRLFEAARDGILILDAVTCKITDVNPFLIELLGYSRAEFLGKELFEIGLLKDAAASQDMYQELQKTGYIRYDDLPLVTKGGQRREVEFVSNVYEENGKQVIQCNIRDITQRKQIAAALRESEERYQSIVSNVPGMVYQFALHPDGSVSWPFVGPGCRELFEAEPETLRKDPVWLRTQIHPDDLGTYDSTTAASAATLLPLEWGGRLCLPSGATKWVQITSRPQRLPDGGTLWNGFAMDVTARKESEEERDRFFILSLDMLAIIGSDGYMKRLNPAFGTTLGFSNTELMAVPFLEFVHPDDIAATLAEMANLESGAKVLSFENRYRCRNGSYKWLRWMCAPLEELWYCVAHDVTSTKQAEAALRASEARKSAMLETALDCIIGIDAQSRILEWNPASEKTFGYAREEVMGRLLPELIIPESLRAAHFTGMKKYLATGEGPFLSQRIELPALRKNGEEFPVELAITRIESAGIPVFTAYLRDITQRKQAESSLEIRAQIAALGADVGMALTRLGSLQSTLHLCSEAIVKHLDAAFARIWTLDEQATVLELQASAGLYTHLDGAHSRVPVGQFKIGLIAAERQPHLTNSVIDDPRVGDQEWARREGMVAFAGYPLIVGDRVVGVMAMFSRGELSDVTLKGLAAVADEIALGIEHKRTEQALLVANEDLELRVTERTAALTQMNAKLEVEIAERLRAEAEVQRSRQELQSFIDAMSTLAAKVAPDGTFLIANKVAFDASELSREAYMKTNFLEGPWWSFDAAVQTRVREKFREALSGTEINYDESIFVFGQTRTINFSLIPMRGVEGEVEYLIAEGRDITDLKHIEVALREARDQADAANLAKSEFLSRMSHELRTPLNAILGFGQILEKQELAPRQKESVGYILKGGRHLLGLINEVLDIARVEAGHMDLSIEPVALADVVPEACALMRTLAAERSIRLQENKAELGSTHILADRQRLKQVLINLLANAIKYNREGGEVVISCDSKPNGWMAIAVRDTGPGISAHDLTKLFTPFERLDAANSTVEGTGLGLVLSQRLVTAIGGTLRVQSTLGEGTTFTLEFAQVASPEARLATVMGSTHHLEITPKVEKTYSVLCIEDNASNLRFMELLFQDRPDITLLTAIQGSIGLDLARQHKPDLILLDLDLPDIHGSEVMARLQQSSLTRKVPVVIVSADATPNQIERLLAAGAKAYLTKPLDVDQLFHTLEIYLQVIDLHP